MHPDKIADRIAGAIVDLGYRLKPDHPRIAAEVLLGHGMCYVIIETDVNFKSDDIEDIIRRIAGEMQCIITIVPQDSILNQNQNGTIRCGDNGIFKGVPLTEEQKQLSAISRRLYRIYPTDGKYILDKDRLIICQSSASAEDIMEMFPGSVVNPLGYWTGGTDVDSGATNRKLGSDMADSVSGGGLHGKDLSKADVSINIYAFLKAQETGIPVELSCAIGDEIIDGRPYQEIAQIAKDYIDSIGGFEKFAEWGLF